MRAYVKRFCSWIHPERSITLNVLTHTCRFGSVQQPRKSKGLVGDPSLVDEPGKPRYGVPTAVGLSFPSSGKRPEISCPPSWMRLKSDYALQTISPPSSLHSPTKRPFAVRRALFWDRRVLLKKPVDAGHVAEWRDREGKKGKDKSGNAPPKVIERRIESLLLKFSYDSDRLFFAWA